LSYTATSLSNWAQNSRDTDCCLNSAGPAGNLCSRWHWLQSTYSALACQVKPTKVPQNPHTGLSRQDSKLSLRKLPASSSLGLGPSYLRSSGDSALVPTVSLR
jgi:hypothetical protein